MKTQPKTFKRLAPRVLIAALILLALNPGNPIGYYSIMRWIVCGAFAYLAVESHERKETTWVWVWCVAAGIYNPIAPVEASRELWSLVNIVSVCLIAFDVLFSSRALAAFRRDSITPEIVAMSSAAELKIQTPTARYKIKYIIGSMNPDFVLPWTGQFYGIGKMMLGRLADRDWKDSYSIKQGFLTILFIPILPLEFYLVREENEQDVYYGAVPFCAVWDCFTLKELIKFYVTTFAKGFLPLIYLCVTFVTLFFVLDFVINRWG